MSQRKNADEPAINGEGSTIELATAKHRELSRMWRSAVRKVTEAKQTLESMERIYETLAEASMESLECEIVAVERSASAGPCHRESLQSSLGKVNEEDLPETKGLDDGVRGIENACTEAKKIVSKSCGQVGVVVAESARGFQLRASRVSAQLGQRARCS